MLRDGIRRILRIIERFSLPVLSRRAIVISWILGTIFFGLILWLIAADGSFPVLDTKGEIANRQRDLLFFAVALSVIVLVPVYYFLFTFAWRYKEGHKKDYKPEWDDEKKYEITWWSIPILIIGILAVVTFNTSHSLDPYKPLVSSKKPVQVQVIAMEWKWLFIYPEYRVATVNELAIPIQRPIELTITSDAPMNSFWIPQLAGQVYAMSGMSTKLHISADETGIYEGLSSNISGAGFSGMKFKVRSMPDGRFSKWVENRKREGLVLDATQYEKLSTPTSFHPVSYFVLPEGSTLYDDVVMKFGHGMSENSGNISEKDHEKSNSLIESEHSGTEEMAH